MQRPKTPIQKALEKIQEHIETIAKYCEAKENKKQEELDRTAKVEVRLPVEVSAYYEAENGERRIQNRRDTVRFWLEVGGLSVAVILVCLTLGTLRVFQGQLQEMQKQTKATDRNFRRDERSWVGLDVPVTLDAIAVQAPRVVIKGHYSVKNFGHGPATKINSQYGMFVDPTDKTVAENESQGACDGPIDFATGTVPVAGGLKQPPPLGYTLFPNQGHDELIDYTATTDYLNPLRFVGCIAYVDQFKVLHWTRFCMERKLGDLRQVPELAFCALYNDTDPDETQ
jgi:hypothetical protein